jgi:uncharacterized iron-regulated membrane protein
MADAEAGRGFLSGGTVAPPRHDGPSPAALAEHALGERELTAVLSDAAGGVSAVALCERTPASATLELTTLEGASMRLVLTRTGADVAGAAPRAAGTSAFDSLHSLLMAHSKAYGLWFLAAAAQRALAARLAADDDDDSEDDDDDAASR